MRLAIPEMQRLTIEELRDSTPQILHAMADALESDDPALIKALVERAPQQGLSRLQLRFDIKEVMQEDRLLRAITVQHVNAKLERGVTEAEAEALHTVIDVMLQRSVIALVETQRARAEAAADTELKFFSFLSHDIKDNLASVTMSLRVVERQLKKTEAFAEVESALSRAQECIEDTVSGMRQMLEHQQLRRSNLPPLFSRVDLYQTTMKIVGRFARKAEEKECQLIVDMKEGTSIESNEQLLILVLQNLIGNGVQFSRGKPVRIGFGQKPDDDRHLLWVSDQGPGIATEKLDDLIDTFSRGDSEATSNTALGLVIASQAATLLGAELSVESTLGIGSVFCLKFPASHVAERSLAYG